MQLPKLLTAVVLTLSVRDAAWCVTIVTYNDAALWRRDVGNQSLSVIQEPFLAGGLNLPGLTVTSSVGHIGPGGGWDDQLSDTQTTTFAYPNPGGVPGFDAFGGFWDLAGPEGGPGPGIQVTLNLSGGGTLVVPQQIPSSLAGGFWGLIAFAERPMRFFNPGIMDSFTLSAGSGCGLDCVSDEQRYHLSLLELGVPEPSTWPAIALALAALATWRRRLLRGVPGSGVGSQPSRLRPRFSGTRKAVRII